MGEDGHGGHADAAEGPAGHEERLLGHLHQQQRRHAGGEEGEGACSESWTIGCVILPREQTKLRCVVMQPIAHLIINFVNIVWPIPDPAVIVTEHFGSCDLSYLVTSMS